jgi:hypothetical protein
MALKKVLVYESVFQRVWKIIPVGLVEVYLGGMEEYHWNWWKCIWEVWCKVGNVFWSYRVDRE